VPERETIVAAIEPVLATLGLEVFDVQLTGSGRASTVRVIVDRDGGVDLDAITAASERIQPALDALDDLGPYALEVSSPGLERPLRTPAHFARALGDTVSVKTDGQRVRGVITAVDDAGFDLLLDDGTTDHIAYSDVAQARTVFEWGGEQKRTKTKNARSQKEPVRR
jgi:ribosome maturation factor RimP